VPTLGIPSIDPARRARIVQRLDQIGPGPKGLYLTLCGLIDASPDWPSLSMLLFHTLRELESGVRAVLREKPLRGSAEPVRETGQEERPATKQTAGTGEVCEACGAVDGVVPGENHKNEISAIGAHLGLDPRVVTQWRNLAGKLQGWAHRHNLELPEGVDEQVLDRVVTLEWILDAALDAFAARYRPVVERIAALVATENPTKAHARRLQTDFPQDPYTQELFYQHAEARWLAPLLSAGAFKKAPGVQDAGDGYIRYPAWPAADYLTRIAIDARHIPEAGESKERAAIRAQVAQIALDLPQSENPRVHLALVAIAATLEPARAARLVDRLVRAFTSPYLLGLDQYAALTGTLADADQGAAARTLLRAMLAVSTPEDSYSPIPRIGDWEFSDLLEHDLAGLTHSMGVDIVDLLLALLAEIPAPRHELSARSRAWLAAVAEGTLAEPASDPRATLAIAARQAAALLSESGVAVTDILDHLPDDGPDIVRRLRLHVLGEHADVVPDLVREALADPWLLHEERVEPEWLRLLHAHAALLTPEQQAAVLTAMDQGPELDADALTEDAIRLKTMRWQWNRYGAAAAILTEPARTAYKQLIERFGPPSFLRRDRVIEAPEPVALVADLSAAESTADLVAAVNAAAPQPGPDQFASPYYLAQQVRSTVDAGASAYSKDAATLADLDEPYLSHAVSGFDAAVRRGEAVEWTGLLALLELLTATPTRPGTVHEAMTLLSTAAERSALPKHAADTAWRIINAASSQPATLDWTTAECAHVLHTQASFARWAHRVGADTQPAAAALASIDLNTAPGPIATALGQELWTLVQIDAPGAAERVRILAPGTPVFSAYLGAGFHWRTAQLLLRTYRLALEKELNQADHENLGRHMLELYWTGLADLASGGLPDTWWRHPHTMPDSAEQLAHMLVGANPGPGARGEAFIAFLDWRLTALTPQSGSAPGKEARRELLSMGAASVRAAPIDQALPRLHRVIEVVGELPSDVPMWNRLVEAMSTNPGEVLELLVEWTKRLSPHSHLPSRREKQLTAIWGTAVAGGDPGQTSLAQEAMNRAAYAGFHRLPNLVDQGLGSDRAEAGPAS
jgi:hypothetical protein